MPMKTRTKITIETDCARKLVIGRTRSAFNAWRPLCGVRLLRPDEAAALTACLEVSEHPLEISKTSHHSNPDGLLNVCLEPLLNQRQARAERGEQYMRRTKLVRRITDRSADRVDAESHLQGSREISTTRAAAHTATPPTRSFAIRRPGLGLLRASGSWCQRFVYDVAQSVIGAPISSKCAPTFGLAPASLAPGGGTQCGVRLAETETYSLAGVMATPRLTMQPRSEQHLVVGRSPAHSA